MGTFLSAVQTKHQPAEFLASANNVYFQGHVSLPTPPVGGDSHAGSEQSHPLPLRYLQEQPATPTRATAGSQSTATTARSARRTSTTTRKSWAQTPLLRAPLCSQKVGRSSMSALRFTGRPRCPGSQRSPRPSRPFPPHSGSPVRLEGALGSVEDFK